MLRKVDVREIARVKLEDVKDVLVKSLNDVATAVTVFAPYIASFLRAVRIVAVKLPDLSTIAFTDGYTIYINVYHWLNLSDKDRAYVIIHELLHFMFRHPQRTLAVLRYYAQYITDEDTLRIVNNITNFVCDVFCDVLTPPEIKTDKLHRLSGYDLARFMRELGIDFDDEDLRNHALEDILTMILDKLFKERKIDALKNLLKKVRCTCSNDVLDESLVKELLKNVESIVLQEGDSSLYSRSREEFEYIVREKLAHIYAMCKQAGILPAFMVRELEKLLEAKVKWRILLREYVKEAITGRGLRTWLRVNRRFPHIFPGYRRYNVPNIYALIDTSGSITQTELDQFASELYSILNSFKEAKLTVIFWDAVAYDPMTVKSPQELVSKWRQYCKGGGGTVIKPALQKLLKVMRDRGIVIVMSDAEIYDIEEEETQKLLRDVCGRAVASIFLSSKEKPPLPQGWNFIKIEV